MKKIIPILLVMILMLTGCSKNYANAQKNISNELGGSFTVTNIYQDNTLKKAVAKDNHGNFYLFTIDGKDRLIFADIYDSYKKDELIKEKMQDFLQDDYLLYVQYNINESNVCDIYLFTDYQINIPFIAKNFVDEISELSNAEINFHTATVDSKENLRKFNVIINKELEKTGIFTEDVENKISSEVSDYYITTITMNN